MSGSAPIGKDSFRLSRAVLSTYRLWIQARRSRTFRERMRARRGLDGYLGERLKELGGRAYVRTQGRSDDDPRAEFVVAEVRSSGEVDFIAATRADVAGIPSSHHYSWNGVRLTKLAPIDPYPHCGDSGDGEGLE